MTSFRMTRREFELKAILQFAGGMRNPTEDFILLCQQRAQKLADELEARGFFDDVPLQEDEAYNYPTPQRCEDLPLSPRAAQMRRAAPPAVKVGMGRPGENPAVQKAVVVDQTRQRNAPPPPVVVRQGALPTMRDEATGNQIVHTAAPPAPKMIEPKRAPEPVTEEK